MSHMLEQDHAELEASLLCGRERTHLIQLPASTEPNGPTRLVKAFKGASLLSMMLLPGGCDDWVVGLFELLLVRRTTVPR